MREVHLAGTKRNNDKFGYVGDGGEVPSLRELFDVFAGKAQPWRKWARCADLRPIVIEPGEQPVDIDPNWFFPPRGSMEDLGKAQAVCAACAVESECLQWSLEQGTDLRGVFGGKSEKWRNVERRRLHYEKAATGETPKGWSTCLNGHPTPGSRNRPCRVCGVVGVKPKTERKRTSDKKYERTKLRRRVNGPAGWSHCDTHDFFYPPVKGCSHCEEAS